MIITVEDLKQYANIFPESDDLLVTYIKSSQFIVEDYLGYAIEQADYKKRYDGLGYPDLRLGIKPIKNITKLVANDLTLSDYTIEGDFILLSKGTFLIGIKNVYVEFTAGYELDEVPEIMKMTVLRIASLLATEADGNIGITSKSFADTGTRTFQNFTNFDKFLKPLSRYRCL